MTEDPQVTRRNRMPALALIGAIVAAALTGTPAAAQPLRKLELGTLAAHDFDPAFVALDRGIFAQHGLEVTITRIAAVGNVPPALFSNSVDIAPASPVALLQAAEAGLDLVGVAGAARGRQGAADSSLVALAASGITGPKDLIGKKIGVSSLNSFWNLMVKKWLVLHDIAPDRVTWVEVQLPVMRDALRRGSVDAVAAVEPFRGSMLHDPAFANVADYPLEVNATVVESLWMATRPWATAHKAEIDAFRAAMREAVAFIAQHPQEAEALIAKHWTVATVASPTYFTDLDVADFAFFVALTRQFGVVASAPDPTTLIIAR